MNEAVRPRAISDAGAPTTAERLDRLPVTCLHLGILALSALGLFADIAEVALSNAFSGIFLAPPYSVSRGDLALLLAAVFAGGAIGHRYSAGWRIAMVAASRYRRRL